MPIQVLLPIYVGSYLHVGPEWYDFLLAAVGGGFLLGYLLSSLLRLDGKTRARVVIGLMLLAPAPSIAIGFVSAKPAALLASVLLGTMLAVINVQHISILQTTTPPKLRGRIMSLNSTVASGLVPIGMAFGGIAGDLTGKNIPLVYIRLRRLGSPLRDRPDRAPERLCLPLLQEVRSTIVPAESTAAALIDSVAVRIAASSRDDPGGTLK